MRGIEEMIQFQCDYEEGACPQILERLVETNLEQTVGYSEDEYCKQAREKIKKACDAPEAGRRDPDELCSDPFNPTSVSGRNFSSDRSYQRA